MKTDCRFNRLKICIKICIVIIVTSACRPSVSDTGTLVDETGSVMETDISHLATQKSVDIDKVKLTKTLTSLPSKEVPTMFPVCTPPACDPDETYYCPGDCPGGCGTICATVTPGISSDTGQVWGKVCYPEETVSEMTIYFLEINTQNLIEVSLAETQNSYEIELLAGVYVAFARLANNDIGGGYTQFVRCSETILSCTDHSLVPFLVQENHVYTDADICDWDTDQTEFPILSKE